MSISSQPSGSAKVQGELWGARTRDWADVQEKTGQALYEAVMVKPGVEPGAAVLDVGCGTGMFCELATRHGAKVSGLDATPAFIAIARKRAPHGDFRVGDMENLPFDDLSFDLVTGFNSFFYAANPANALSEARRVARDGAHVVIATWGKAADCEVAALMGALRPLLPPPPPGALGPFALSEGGALETLATKAELSPVQVEEVDSLWDYPDEETALRGYLSAGPQVRAIRLVGEGPVREVTQQALAQFKKADGHYRMHNKFLYLIAKR